MSLPPNIFDVPERKRLTPRQRAEMFFRHKGVCCVCGGKIHAEREKWIDEHIIPLADWGQRAGDPNEPENRGPAHAKCARDKTSAEAKSRGRLRKAGMRNMGIRPKSQKGSSFQTNRDGKWKAKIGGGVERRD